MDFAIAIAGIGLAAGAIPSPALPRSHAIRMYAPRATSERFTRAFPLKRTVTVLTGALRALLAGHTAAERARGCSGWFSRKTAGHLRSVRVEAGVADVYFRSLAGSSSTRSRRPTFRRHAGRS